VNGSAGTPGLPPESLDEALQRLRAERDSISAALLDLESHHAHRLLKGAELAGETLRRWAATRDRIRLLWELFDLYRQTLTRVERFHARRPRPGTPEFAELTHLLTGPAVELTGEEIPLANRSLLGPARSSERLTLDELVARMNRTFAGVTEVIAAVDAAWSALLPRLSQVEEYERKAAGLLGSLQPAEADASRLDKMRRNLADLRVAVLSDPLSLVARSNVETDRFDRIERDLSVLCEELAVAVRIRDEGGAGQSGELGVVVEQVAAAQTEARRARERVLLRIDVPGLPDIPDLAGPLRERLAALAELRRQHRWIDLARRTAGLERAASDALDQLSTAMSTITAPLEHRDELRGRLEAYGAKAVRLGYAEDAELCRLHERAHDLLWRAPCDLRQATMAVKTYQQAVGRRQRRGRELGAP
jgi:hypothetical protein